MDCSLSSSVHVRGSLQPRDRTCISYTSFIGRRVLHHFSIGWNLDSSLCFIQPGILHDVLCIEVKQVGWQHIALTYSFPYFEPVCCSMSSSNCCFLTCIQVSQKAGKAVCYSSLFKNFHSMLSSTQTKALNIVKEVELNVFMEFPCFFYHPMDVDNLISHSSALSKCICDFSVHIPLKPSLKDFEHHLSSMWSECSCVVVWTFFGIVFLWDANENWAFPGLWPLMSFPNLLA